MGKAIVQTLSTAVRNWGEAPGKQAQHIPECGTISAQTRHVSAANPRLNRVRTVLARAFSVVITVLLGESCALCSALAQSPPPIDLAAIARICTGQAPLTIPGGATGTGSSQSGYTFSFTAQKDLEVTSGGVILYKIEKPTLDDVASCVAKIAGVLNSEAAY